MSIEKSYGRFNVVIVLHDLNLASRFRDSSFYRRRLRAVGKPEEVLTKNLLSTLYGTDIVVKIIKLWDVCYSFLGGYVSGNESV